MLKLDLTPIDEPVEKNGLGKLDLTPIEEPKPDNSLRDLLSEDARQALTPDQPIATKAIEEIAKAGERYPAGIMKTIENLQTGEGSINPLENIYTPTPDPRDATQIAQDVGKRVLPEAEIRNPEDKLEYISTVGKEFIKNLPFTTAGAVSELANPVNVAIGGVISKVPHVDIPAPQWVDNAVSGFIKNFGAPFSSLNEAAKTKLVNSITDEIYTKVEPRMDELKANFKDVYGREATVDDIKAQIRNKLDSQGIQEKNVGDLTKQLISTKLKEPISATSEALKELPRPSLETNPIVEGKKSPAIIEAEKHGSVVGIDSQTKLPIIDTTKPSVVLPEKPVSLPQGETKTQKLDLIPIEESSFPQDGVNESKDIFPKTEEQKQSFNYFNNSLNDLKSGISEQAHIADLPIEIANNKKIPRSVYIDQKIINKIENKHKLPVDENFINNLNTAETLIFPKDNSNKINFIKNLGSGEYLVIGTKRYNGHFVITGFEAGRSDYIDSIKKRGEVLNITGRPLGSSIEKSSLENPSQQELSGVNDITTSPSVERLTSETDIVKPERQTNIEQSPLPKSSITPQDFKAKVEQLNKFAQGQAILRKGASLKTAAGLFYPIPDKGEVKITQEALKDDQVYMTVLSHELGHAVEYNVVGKTNDRRLKVFGDKLDAKTLTSLYKELRNVTEEIAPGGLAGKLAIGDKYGANYYSRPAELIARFFEKMLVSPGNLEQVAPTAIQLLEEQSVKHPIIAEFIEAASGSIDKGAPKHVLFRDLRETFQKYLGKRAGNRAYGDMVAHKAMIERGKIVMQKFLDEKFKDIKDSPEALFRAAESIKITVGGVPEFGTRRYSVARNLEDEAMFLAAGMTKMPMPVVEDGVAYPQYAQWNYTPDQAKAIFNSLSPEGKKLIKDFTAVRSEAKDFFNREMIREVYNVEKSIEGWVHHYFEDRQNSTIMGGARLKNKMASSRKQRTGTEGYVEDFKKAMYKALVDLEGEREWNIFIKKFLARTTKPLADGEKPDVGWVEVEGSLQAGVGMKNERNVQIVQDGKSFRPRYTKYQMPKAIYERYKLLKGLAEEASTAMKVVNDINRYWRINILTHPGTASTNFISGGVQYSAKILNDFYKEVLTGDLKMFQTKKNISAMIKVLSPKGWNSAPDWVYGGDLSNFYGQFIDKPSAVGGAIDAYADKGLKAFGIIERYWKKVIVLSENTRNLESLNKMTTEGLRLPTDEERDMLAALEQATDLYAYNYDNVPLQIDQWRKNPALNAVKPFIVYPYKYMKQVTGMIGKVFDYSIPWQDRIAGLLALATIVGLYASISNERKGHQKTPEADKSMDIPPRLQTRGRMFTGMTDEKGRELFVRVSKYPFLNLSESGMQVVNGNWEGGKDIVSDMIGSVGPVGQVGLLALNFRNKYQQYTPVPVILGDSLASFMPMGRILEDVSRALDPYQRSPETFGQSFTKMIPTTDELLQEKLHGKVRTERVPIENGLKSVETQTGEYKAQGRRTTIDVPLENYQNDILLGLLSGVYLTRIDPEIVEAYITRKEKNAEKKAKKEGRSLSLTPLR